MIRAAVASDRSEWLTLWQGFLAHYKTTLDPAITDHTWDRLMDPTSPLKMRVFDDRGLKGFAIHQHHASTWVSGDDCYLEDLFVTPQARGQGIARALIDDLMNLARSRGWQRIYWMTDEANTTARRLYDSIIPADGHIRYRMTL